jgi:DNA repair protein RadC
MHVQPYPNKRPGILQWAEEDRPREKLLLKGRNSLTDAELIAILIGTGSRSETAVDLAKRILQEASHDLNRLARMSVKDLCRIKGIGEAKAITIQAAIELSRRRNETEQVPDTPLISSKASYAYMRPELLDLPIEQFWIILLNQALHPIKKIKICEGGISHVVVDLRVLFKEALSELATSIVLVHNHPSGKLNPSQEDISLTRKIVSAAELLQIRVLDHIIFTNNGYYSFSDEGAL